MLSGHVTHGLAGAFAANTCVLGLLVESVVASIASLLTLLQGSRAARSPMRFRGDMHITRVICISPRKPIVRAHVLILPARLLDISLGAAL